MKKRNPSWAPEKTPFHSETAREDNGINGHMTPATMAARAGDDWQLLPIEKRIKNKEIVLKVSRLKITCAAGRH